MENLYVITVQKRGEDRYFGFITRNDYLSTTKVNAGEKVFLGALSTSMMYKVSQILGRTWGDQLQKACFHCDGIEFGKIQMLIEMSVTKND